MKEAKKKTALVKISKTNGTTKIIPGALMKDIRLLIESARGRAAAAVNAEMVLLYWSVGERIRRDILGKERAEYGKRIVLGTGHK